MDKKVPEKKFSFVKITDLPKRKCPTCGEEFAPKRTDQKFCRTECRNGFHNGFQRATIHPFKKSIKFCQHITTNAKNPNLVSEELNKIFRNREILHTLFSKGEQKVPLQRLQQLGFDTTIFTSSIQKLNQSFVLDYGLQSLGNNEIKIFERA